MANSLITIQLKLDALKIQVETPTSAPSSQPKSPGAAAGQPGSAGAPDLGLKEVREQFSALATDLKAVASTVQGIKDVAAALAGLENSIKGVQSSLKQGKTESTGGAADPELAGKISASKARIAEIEKEIAAQSEAAAASAKTTEASKAQTEATKETAQAAEQAAQSLKSEASARAQTTDGADSMQKALALLQSKFLASAEGSKSSAASLALLDRVSRAKTQKELELGKSVQGRKSPIAVFLESLFPVGSDADFKAQAEKFNTASSSVFITLGKGVNKGSDAVKALVKEIDNIQKVAALKIQQDPLGTNARDVASSVRGQSEQALARFRESSGGGPASIKSQEQKAGILALSFVAQMEKAVEALRGLSSKIEAGADDIEKAPFETAFNQVVTNLSDFAAKIVNAKGSPFANVQPAIRGGEVRDFRAQVLENVSPKIPDTELNDFQRNLVTLAQSLIATKEATQALPIIFRELARDVGNFEENQRVVKEAINRAGSTAFGGFEREGVAKDVLSKLNTKTDAAGRFVTPTGTDTNTSFELLRANINRLKNDVASLGKGGTLNKVFNFTDAAGNVQKIQVVTKQLGSTLDTVRVKAQLVSKDLFNRVTVRAALSRVATWGAAASVVFGAIEGFKSAVSTIISTESAVVKLAKVMEESKKDFDGFTDAATKSALRISQEFGQPLQEVLETMITFGQQGLTFPEVEAGTTASALAAVVTTLNQPQAADALTAATEQFGLELTDATLIIDKFNNVANNAAVTETVLSEALKKAGIAASNAGVDLDQFNGIVAAIAEQTRQSGNEVGTALRFIFSRINTAEAERGLAKVGISVKDAEGNLRPFVAIITDLKNKFGELSKAEQTQAAISVAGTRRFNTLLALLKNFSTFQDSVSNSVNSAGSSLEQQAIVAETAAFKITQLKNAAAGAAVSFGAVLSPALKASTDIAKGFFDIISALPTSVQALAVSLGAAGIAFSKFSQTFVSLADTALPGGGVFSTLAASLTTGETEQNLRQRAPGLATTISQRAGDAGQGIFAARAVGDFAKGKEAVKSFNEALKASGSVLVDLNGKQLQNAASITKFTAITRGYKTVAKDSFDAAGNAIGASNIGLLGLNTTVGRIAASLVGLSGKILKLVPILGPAFDNLAGSLQESTSGALRFSGALLKVIGAGLLIAGVVEGFKLIKNALTETGDTVAKNLQPEIAKRQEVIRSLAKQKTAVDSLADSQRELARLQVEQTQQPEVVRREAIRRGDFKSPELEQRRLDAAQREVDNTVGFANPQLIDSVDEFGNVILKTATSFNTLAQAAGSANERLLALAQVKIAKAFQEDIEGSDGLVKSFVHAAAEGLSIIPFLDDVAEATVSSGKKFREASEALERFKLGKVASEAIEQANRLGVPLREVSKGVDETLNRLTRSVEEASGPITEKYLKIIKALESVPKGQAVTTLNEISSSIEQLASQQSKLSGVSTTASDFVGKILLANSTGLKSLKKSIQFNAEDTRAALNEAGFLDEAIKIGANVRETINKEFEKGDLVIVGGTQAEVQVNAFGDRIVQVLNDATNRVEPIKLADLIDSQGVDEVFKFSTKGITKQINLAVSELSRVATGAGRGILLETDVNLGANRQFDLSAQQRVSQTDEVLIRDLLEAQKSFTNRRDDFKAQLDQDAGAAISTSLKNEIEDLAEDFDKLATITKFRTAIEEVGKSFEKALDTIQRNNLSEAISSQIESGFGAAAGIPKARFEAPVSRFQLSAEQRAASATPDVTKLANSITDFQGVQERLATESALASREVGIVLRDFQAARGQGGIGDRSRLSQLASEAIASVDKSEAQKLQEVSSNQLQEARHHTDQLERLIAATKLNPATFAQELTSATATGAVSQQESARQSGALTEEQLKKVSTTQLSELAKTQGTSVPENIQRELLSRKIEGRAGLLNLDALKGRLGENQQAPSGNFFQDAVDKALKSAVLPTSNPQVKALTEAAINLGVLGRQSEVTNEELDSLAQTLLSTLSGTEAAKGLKGQLSSESGRDEVREGIRKFLDDVTPVFTAAVPTLQRAAPRDVVSEAQSARASLDAQTQGAIETANSQLIKESKTLAESFLILAKATAQVEKAFDDNIISALQKLDIDAKLADLGVAGAQSGALAGLSPLLLDIGKSARNNDQLTGSDVTLRESTSLVTAANQTKILQDTLIKAFTEIQSGIAQTTRDRDEAAASGDTKKAGLLTTGINKLLEQAAALNPQIEEGADSLRQFGEAIRNVTDLNQLSLDIDKLFKSLDQEVALQFDRTSIDSALGSTVFSLIKPTFEQFEQGQAGFATKFDRAIADIAAQRSEGTITSAEATRLESKAAFTRDEGVIQLAQEKENRSLQIEIQAAEQIRKRLLEFSTAGGQGAEEARKLFDQLTGELQSAGDIIESSVGSKTIRNPLTGQEENVPASQILQFKGLPGLEGIQSAVSQLTQASKAEEAAKNASLINVPIVDSVENMRSEVVAALIANQESLNEQVTSSRGILEAITAASNLRGDVTTALSTEGPAQDQAAARFGKKVDELISAFGQPAAAEAARATSIVPGQDVIEALQEIVQTTEENSIASKIAKEALESLGAKSDELTKSLGDVDIAFKAIADLLSNTGSAFGVQKRASGGVIFGPGGPKDDRVPIMASPGEYVVNAAAVQKFGVKNLDEINSKGATGKQKGRKYADGGFIFEEEDKFSLEKASEERRNKRALEAKKNLDPFESERKGKFLRFDGPTGTNFFQVDQETNDLESLRERAKNAPTKGQLQEKVSDLTSEEARRISNLAGDSKKRLRSSSLLTGKDNFVVVKDDGTISFSDSRQPGSIRVGPGGANNIDLSSAKNFRADVSRREDNVKRIKKVSKSDTQESLEKQKEKILQERENRLSKVNEIESGFLDNRSNLSSSLKFSNDLYYNDVSQAYKNLQTILERASTPKGRQDLRDEEELVRELLAKSTRDIKYWNEVFSGLEETQFQFKNPISGEPSGDPLRLLLGSGTTVEPGVGVKGSEVYGVTPLIENLRSGALLQMAASAEETLGSSVFKKVGNFSAISDAVLTSKNIPDFYKAEISGALGATQGAYNLIEGTAKLGVDVVSGIKDLPKNVLENGLVDTAKSTVTGAYGVGKGIVTGTASSFAETGQAIGNIAGGIATGADVQEIGQETFKLGEKGFDVALTAASVKPTVGAVRSTAGKTTDLVKNASLSNIKKLAAEKIQLAKSLGPAAKDVISKGASGLGKAKDSVLARITKTASEDTAASASARKVKADTATAKPVKAEDLSKITEELAATTPEFSRLNKLGLAGAEGLSTLAGSAAGGIGIKALIPGITSGAASLLGGIPLAGAGFLGAEALFGKLFRGQPFSQSLGARGAAKVGRGAAKVGGIAARGTDFLSGLLGKGKAKLDARSLRKATEARAANIKGRGLEGVKPFEAPTAESLKELLDVSPVQVPGLEAPIGPRLQAPGGKALGPFTSSPEALRYQAQAKKIGGRTPADLEGIISDFNLDDVVGSLGIEQASSVLDDFILGARKEAQQQSLGRNLARSLEPRQPVVFSGPGIDIPRGVKPPRVTDPVIAKQLEKAGEGFGQRHARGPEPLTRSQLVDEVLGKGGFQALEEAGVKLRPSVFDDLRSGTDVENISKILKDEALKIRVSRQEFVQERLAAGPKVNVRKVAKPSKAPSAVELGDTIRPDSISLLDTLPPTSAPKNVGVAPRGKKGIFGKNKAPLSDADLIDNILGKGGYESLQQAGVKLRPSVFEDLAAGTDVQNITQILKDEALKVGLKRIEDLTTSELILRRQSARDVKGVSIPESVGAKKLPTEAFEDLKDILKDPEAIEFYKQRGEAAEISFAREKAEALRAKAPKPAADPAIVKEASEFFEKKYGKFVGDELPILSNDNIKKILDFQRIPANTAVAEALKAKYKKKFATGGRVQGPGGPKSDQVPILASNGEFVVNAETVSRLGVPFFDSINKGIPIEGKFADGGLIGTSNSSNSSGSDVNVKIDTDNISDAIEKAISAAYNSVELPELQVNLEGVSVPIDVPQNGLPLDTSGLKSDLGGNLGSGVRNKLEALDGTVQGLREDTNDIQASLKSVDFSSLSSLTTDVSDIKDKIAPIENRVTKVEEKFETQKQEILTAAFTLVNQQLDNLTIENDLNYRIDTLGARTNSQFVELGDSIANALNTANRALAQALARV